MTDETLAVSAVALSGVCVLLGLVLPSVVFWRSSSRRAAALTAGVFAAVGTVAFLIGHTYMPVEAIRVDLVFLPPLLGGLWLASVLLEAWPKGGKPPGPPGSVPRRRGGAGPGRSDRVREEMPDPPPGSGPGRREV